jgi:ribosomal protein L23
MPLISDKSYKQAQKGIYTFIIEGDASKQAIAEAIAKEFGVTVISVRVQNRDGKAMRFAKGVRRRAWGTTHKADKKITFVTLKAGDKIKGFLGEEEETPAEPAKKEKATKEAKADKKAKKAEETK